MKILKNDDNTFSIIIKFNSKEIVITTDFGDNKFNTEIDAENFAKTMLNLAKPKHFDKNNTLSTYKIDIDEAIRRSDYKEATKNRFGYTLTNYIDPYFQTLKISQLEDENVINVYKNLINIRRDIKKSYKKKIFSSTRYYLKLLEELFNIKIPYANLKTRIDEVNEVSEFNYYTLDEYLRFRKFLSNKKYLLFFDLLFFLGLRKNEAKALKINDFDLTDKKVKINKNVYERLNREGRIVVFSTKNNSSNRILPLPDLIIDDFKIFENNSKDKYLFASDYKNSNKLISDSALEFANKQAAKKANLKHIRIHDFRHSCAIYLFRSGIDPSLISKYLGHKNLNTTMQTYIHCLQNETQKVKEFIDTVNLKIK